MEGVCGGMSAQCLHLLSTFFIVVVFLVEKVTDRLVWHSFRLVYSFGSQILTTALLCKLKTLTSLVDQF